MPKVKWKAKSEYYPRKVTPSVIRKYFQPVIIKTRDRALGHYESIVKPWSSESTPVFRKATGKKHIKGMGLCLYSTVGITTESTPLYWLDGGTKVRRRAMSRNWKSKTYYNMKLAPQRAGMGYATKKWGNYPGIKPRNFRDGVVDDIQYDFYREAREAYSRMCKELWG